MFDQMRPNIVALEEPSNWQKDNQKMLKNMANSQAFKAKLVAFNKECKEKMKEEVALRTLKNKLSVFELEQSISQEINKVDCLEEEVMTTKDLYDEAMGITKPGHAQTQNLLVKVNIGDG
ncbi:hypothetical protein Adt_05248 [Abeliophyllum distichum]|uniref:Uncharacterized protein n=1 Tax=Abeliophyllum distichum TaxID=126358 RepID=A0ABD1V3K5_9LAMI